MTNGKLSIISDKVINDKSAWLSSARAVKCAVNSTKSATLQLSYSNIKNDFILTCKLSTLPDTVWD